MGVFEVGFYLQDPTPLRIMSVSATDTSSVLLAEGPKDPATLEAPT